MKKLLHMILLLSVVILYSNCTDEVVGIDDALTAVFKENPKKRSVAEAIQIAQNAIPMLDDSTQTRNSLLTRQIDFGQSPVVVCSNEMKLTRSAESEGIDTLMYVINYADNQGFAVVSADRATEGLIAVIESGEYNPSDTTDTGFRRYMAAAKLYISANRVKENKEPSRAPKGFYFEYDTVGINTIPARITVKWGQDFHEGQFCPNGDSGCSHTAAAMIMSYFEYPSYLVLTYLTPNVYRTLNWSGMKNYINCYDCLYYVLNGISYCTNEDHKSIGHLCRELAHKTGNHFFYNPNKTQGGIDQIRTALLSIGYSVGNVTSYQNFVNTSTIMDYLSDGKLIFMCGFNNFNGNGHAWAIDGYYGFTVHSCYYEYGFTNGLPDPPILMDEQYNTHRYNHINWGQNGINNGYFVDGVFSYYGNAYSYDSNYYVHTTTDPDLMAEGNFANNVQFITIYKN